MEKDIFLRRETVMEMLGQISLSTLYRMIDDGRVPKPVKLSKQVAVWKRSWIQNIVDSLDTGDTLEGNLKDAR